MNIQALQAAGPYCPIDSYLSGKAWVPSDQTNIAATFQREIARMRSPYYETDYEDVEASHHAMFPGGFER